MYSDREWGIRVQNARSIIYHSTFQTLKTPGKQTGNFIHVSAGKGQRDVLEEAFVILHGMQRKLDDIINLPNDKGQSAFDLAWNHKQTKEMIRSWGGYSLKPITTAPRDGKGGKDSKGRGKGGRDGVTVDHRYNRANYR